MGNSFTPAVRTRRMPRSFARMERIIERCFPWKYGRQYIPAILASRVEGPSAGRLHRVSMPKWDRDMHFMSAAEVRVAVHLIYQPDLIECLENRPCCPVPGIAILDGHPLLIGKVLPASSGSVEIARYFGLRHPVCYDQCLPKQSDGPRRKDFFPLISDLLAILNDGSGVRAVNLYVKKRASDLVLTKRQQELLLIERVLYAESKIPTVTISEDDLDPVVTNNLFRLAKAGRRPENLSDEQIALAILYMQEQIFCSAPHTWETYLRENYGLLAKDLFNLFHYAVFHRHLKVDLREAVAMNRIHRKETMNFAANFAGRFLEPLR